MVGTFIRNKCVIRWETVLHVSFVFLYILESRGSGFFALDCLYKDFFFREQREIEHSVSLCEAEADLFIVQDNKDNVFWAKVRWICLIWDLGIPQFRVLQLWFRPIACAVSPRPLCIALWGGQENHWSWSSFCWLEWFFASDWVFCLLLASLRWWQVTSVSLQPGWFLIIGNILFLF